VSIFIFTGVFPLLTEHCIRCATLVRMVRHGFTSGTAAPWTNSGPHSDKAGRPGSRAVDPRKLPLPTDILHLAARGFFRRGPSRASSRTLAEQTMAERAASLLLALRSNRKVPIPT
jgi:hypothetical protein